MAGPGNDGSIIGGDGSLHTVPDTSGTTSAVQAGPVILEDRYWYKWVDGTILMTIYNALLYVWDASPLTLIQLPGMAFTEILNACREWSKYRKENEKKIVAPIQEDSEIHHDRKIQAYLLRAIVSTLAALVFVGSSVLIGLSYLVASVAALAVAVLLPYIIMAVAAVKTASFLYLAGKSFYYACKHFEHPGLRNLYLAEGFKYLGRTVLWAAIGVAAFYLAPLIKVGSVVAVTVTCVSSIPLAVWVWNKMFPKKEKKTMPVNLGLDFSDSQIIPAGVFEPSVLDASKILAYREKTSMAGLWKSFIETVSSMFANNQSSTSISIEPEIPTYNNVGGCDQTLNVGINNISVSQIENEEKKEEKEEEETKSTGAGYKNILPNLNEHTPTTRMSTVFPVNQNGENTQEQQNGHEYDELADRLALLGARNDNFSPVVTPRGSLDKIGVDLSSIIGGGGESFFMSTIGSFSLSGTSQSSPPIIGDNVNNENTDIASSSPSPSHT